MRQKQYAFFNESVSRQFGGLLLKGNAKIARPLSTKSAIHLVLKSHLAVGTRSFLCRQNSKRIDAIVRRLAKLNGIRLYHFINVGNHLHLVVRLEHSSPSTGRRAFNTFIRAATGLIARQVLHTERGRGKGIKFWQARPFTRLVNWGRDFRQLNSYMKKNTAQARARCALFALGFGKTDALNIARLNTG